MSVMSPHPAVKWIFWTLTLSVPIIVTAIGIDLAAYRPFPPTTIWVEGDPIIAFDPDIGHVPFPEGKSRRGGHLYEMRYYTDKRGARVSRPGEQTGDRTDVIFIGDSFTWGDGVAGGDTFAYGVGKRLGLPIANFGMGSYGTTQSVQMLRRNLDLAPRLIVYSFIDDHLWRNVLHCARSYYVFCQDISHVTWEKDGPRIAPPFSNGVRRLQMHVEAQQRGLWPLTWLVHGFDVIFGRVLFSMDKDANDPEKRRAALEFLLDEMSKTAKSINAELLVVYIPAATKAPPAELLQSIKKLNLQFVDLVPAFQVPHEKPLYIPQDGHPSVERHALIADQIAAAVRERGLLR